MLETMHEYPSEASMLVEEDSTKNDDSTTMSQKSNVHNLSSGMLLDFFLVDLNKNNGSYT